MGAKRPGGERAGSELTREGKGQGAKVLGTELPGSYWPIHLLRSEKAEHPYLSKV